MSVKVEISGSVLSGAYFSCFHTTGDEEGLLLGSVREEITHTNNDEQIRMETRYQIFDVTRIALFSSARLFYNKLGEINDSAVQKLVHDSDLSVLGWCKMRQNSPVQMSMYEKIVSQNLNKKLHHTKQHGGSLFCLFASEHNKISTPSFSQHFFQVTQCSNDIKYEKIIPHIRNIGQTNAEYKKHSESNTSSEYSSVLNQHRSDFISGDSVNFSQNIDKLAEHLTTTLQEKAQSVARQERELAELRHEIAQLRQLALQSILEDKSDTPIQAHTERIPIEDDELDQVLTVTDDQSGVAMSTMSADDPIPGQVNLIDLESAISDENLQTDSFAAAGRAEASLYPHIHSELQDDSFEHIELPPAEPKPPQSDSKSADSFSLVTDMMNRQISSFSPVRTPKVKSSAKS